MMLAQDGLVNLLEDVLNCCADYILAVGILKNKIKIKIQHLKL